MALERLTQVTEVGLSTTTNFKIQGITVAFDIKNCDMWRESVFDDVKHHWIKI